MVKGKYFRGKNGLEALSHRQDSSHTCKGIVYGIDLLKKGYRQNVKDGKTIKFWKDKWLDFSILLDKALGSIFAIELEKRVWIKL